MEVLDGDVVGAAMASTVRPRTPTGQHRPRGMEAAPNWSERLSPVRRAGAPGTMGR
jgi:hypothetical protein